MFVCLFVGSFVDVFVSMFVSSHLATGCSGGRGFGRRLCAAEGPRKMKFLSDSCVKPIHVCQVIEAYESVRLEKIPR